MHNEPRDVLPVQKKRSTWLLWVAGASALVVTLLWWRGSFTNWDLVSDETKLAGLTPEEVIAKLGTPSFDPRKPYGSPTKLASAKNPYGPTTLPATVPAWSEATDGPLSLGYFKGWHTYSIDFENGRVKHVRHTMK